MSESHKKSRIPEFKSYEEEVEFWDTHATTEFEDEWVEVDLKAGGPIIHRLVVPLDALTIGKLGDQGRARGLGAATLAGEWLRERLAQEEQRPSDH